MSTKQKDPKNIALDMPEVSDIPGQEHIKPISLRGLSDTTPSSDDEEGKGILDDLNEPHNPEKIVIADTDGENDSDVRPDEKAMLEKMDEIETGTDDDFIREASLDETDEEGDPLNEASLEQDGSGDDLDIPGASDDNEEEELGEEDEENNGYSQGDNR